MFDPKELSLTIEDFARVHLKPAMVKLARRNRAKTKRQRKAKARAKRIVDVGN
jgi:hypothetical protein